MIGSICEVLEDEGLRKRLGENARQMVIERFDLNTVCLPKQVELIETVAAGRKPPPSSYTPLKNDLPRSSAVQG